VTRFELRAIHEKTPITFRHTGQLAYPAPDRVIAAASLRAGLRWLFHPWYATTQLQYNQARWYDPQTQRWLSRDPIEFAAGDGNLYRYVGNNATNLTDPSGRFWGVLAGGLIGAVGGAIIGAAAYAFDLATSEKEFSMGDLLGAAGGGAIAGAIVGGYVGSLATGDVVGLGTMVALGAVAGGAGGFTAGVVSTMAKPGGTWQGALINGAIGGVAGAIGGALAGLVGGGMALGIGGIAAAEGLSLTTAQALTVGLMATMAGGTTAGYAGGYVGSGLQALNQGATWEQANEAGLAGGQQSARVGLLTSPLAFGVGLGSQRLTTAIARQPMVRQAESPAEAKAEFQR
jgi:RHS repeat-associated protein